jgi:glutathione S-transferase
MYTLFIANKNYSSWSLRPWVLMQALGLAFVERLLPFGQVTEGLTIASLSPSGRVPVLEHQGLKVWDSLAITEYLAERHPQVWPAESAARAYARCAAAEMHSGFAALRNDCSMNCGVRVRLHQISAALKADLNRLEQLWQQGLSEFGGPWLAGASFTAVDAFFAPVAFRAQTYGLTFGSASSAYLQRLLALPAMQQWYAAGVAEPWRDAAHEQDLTAAGHITADLRR